MGTWPWWVSLLAGVGRGHDGCDGKPLTDLGGRCKRDGQVAEIQVSGLGGNADDAGDAARLALIARVEQRGRLAVDVAAREGRDVVDDLGRRGREDVERARRTGGGDRDVLADPVGEVRRAHRV